MDEREVWNDRQSVAGSSNGNNTHANDTLSRHSNSWRKSFSFISKMLMDAVETREEVRREEEILSRLQEEESKKEKTNKEQIKEEENEAAEFNRLHSLLPFLGSKSVTELDIVLEAITYIHLLQARLQGGPQRQ